MNCVVLSGRLTSDPKVSEKATNFTLAVDRKFKKDGEQTADFISCVTFGKTAEFVGKYLEQGTKIIAEGRIQTGSYEKNGQKIYTTDVVVESVEFAESKKAETKNTDSGYLPY